MLEHYRLLDRLSKIRAGLRMLECSIKPFPESKNGTILLISPFSFHKRRQGGAIRTNNIISVLMNTFNVIAVEFCWDDLANCPFKVSEYEKSLITISCRHLNSSTNGKGSQSDLAFSSWLTPEMSGLIYFLEQQYQPKIMWHEFSYTAVYTLIHAHSPASSVLSAHNIEANVAHQLQKSSANLREMARSDQYPGEAKALASIEDKLLARFEHIVTTTDIDAAHCRKVAPSASIVVAPNVVTLKSVQMPTADDQHSPSPRRHIDTQLELPLNIVFVGDCKYEPNRLGIAWFVENVYDVLPEDDRKLMSLRVFGNGSLELRNYSREGVSFLGFADSLQEVYNGADAALVPLLHGGGSRLKVFEAIEHMVTLITTHKGSEGIDTDQIHPFALYFSNPQEFSKAVKTALKQKIDINAHYERHAKYSAFLLDQNLKFRDSVCGIVNQIVEAKGQ